jgi:hypothetical protein
MARLLDEQPPEEVLDLTLELNKLEEEISELKNQFEQHFMGILPHPPTKLQQDAVRKIRFLRKVPFKKAADKFRLRTLESRYQTFNTYWQRVLKEKEDGRYYKDIFKANLREKIGLESQDSVTPEGKVRRALHELFNTYKEALKQNGQFIKDIKFEAFEKSLLQKAKAFKEQTGSTKLSFSVVVKDGKVLLNAKGSE